MTPGLRARSRFSLVWLVAVVLGIAVTQRLSMTQAPGIAVPDAVTAQIAADGSAPVIVGVRVPFVPEGDLVGPVDVAAQREAIQAALDSAMGRAQAAGAVLGGGFQTIPFFNARVDAGALAALAAMPDVVSIEVDALRQPSLVQSVPLINVPAAWTAGHTGAGWHVAIVDTGVEKTHSFLANKVVQEACYSNANGAGTGTTTCPGGVTSSTAVGSGVPCTSAIGSCDHGTHVAGIAAGANGPSGASGVAPGANLFAMQVFTIFTGSTNCGSSSPCISAYTSDINRALERAFLLTGGPANDNRLASVNMSLGGGAPSTNCDAANSSTKAAIDNLISRGVATVIASGNNGFTTGISSPACISTAVSVGSTTKTPESISSFTNRGGGLPLLMAPGSSIAASIVNNAFGTKSGTSMATPHVAGAWAVLKQAVPAAGVAQVLNALRTTGVPVAGFPRINVDAARLALLGTGTSVPGAPGTPTIAGSGNNVIINWTPPTTGGTPTGYTVRARLVAGGPVLVDVPVGNTLTLPVTAPDGTFHVSVLASNAAGPGPESVGVTFSVPIVSPPPGATSGLAVTVAGDQADFTWTPPSTGGTPTGYLFVASASAGGTPIATLPLSAPRSGVVIGGIPPGFYFVRVAATNSGGAGPFSNEVTVSVAGPQPPGPPTMNPASVAAGQVAMSWTAPTTGGAATSYVVVASLTPGGPAIANLPVAGLGVTVPAPTGTYFVRVHGVNALGMGPASNEITVVVP